VVAVKNLNASALFLSIAVTSAAVGAGPDAGSQAPATSPRLRCVADDGKSKVVQASPALFDALARNFFSSECEGYLTVVAKLANQQKKAGKQLKGSATLEQQAAQERAAAQANPDYAKALTAALEGETSPLRRKIIEAAELENFGKYSASEVLVNQILAEIGGQR
jgi:hypothetical protein